MIARRKPLPKSRKPIARKPIRKRPRKRASFARIYGSKQRILFIQGLPCAACGVVGYSENAHVAPASEKGTGYKAGFEWVVPLCRTRLWLTDGSGGIPVGCHILYDLERSEFSRRFPSFDAAAEAQKTQDLWLFFSSEIGK